MSIIQIRAALAVGLLSLWPGLAAQATADYYHWVDEDGQSHYSQQPPQDRPAEVRRHAIDRPVQGPEPRPSSTAEPSPPTESDTAESMTLEVQPEPDPALCAQARQLLHSLAGPARMRVRHPDGHHVVLTEADRQEQRQLAQQAIEHHCP